MLFEAEWSANEDSVWRVWHLGCPSFKSPSAYSLNFCSSFPRRNEEIGFGIVEVGHPGKPPC